MTLKTQLIASTLALGFALTSVACAQSPETVCKHIEKVAKKEYAKKLKNVPAKARARALGEVTSGCVKRFKKSKEMKGYFKYRKLSRCIVAADSLDGITKCK